MASFISVSALLCTLAAGAYMIINMATEQMIIAIGVGLMVAGVLYLAKENRESLP